jgi:hypothetical protein
MRLKHVFRAIWAALVSIVAAFAAFGSVHFFERYRAENAPAVRLTSSAGSANTFLVFAIVCVAVAAFLVYAAALKWGAMRNDR